MTKREKDMLFAENAQLRTELIESKGDNKVLAEQNRKLRERVDKLEKQLNPKKKPYGPPKTWVGKGDSPKPEFGQKAG